MRHKHPADTQLHQKIKEEFSLPDVTVANSKSSAQLKDGFSVAKEEMLIDDYNLRVNTLKKDR